MSLAQFTDWVLSLPKADQDISIKSIDGVNYTPRQLLKEAQTGSDVGEKALQMFLEGRLVGSPPGASERSLAIDRIKERLSTLDPKVPLYHTLKVGDQQIPPGKILESIETGGELGEDIIRVEMEYLQYLQTLQHKAKQG
jgi:hypothetical protein